MSETHEFAEALLAQLSVEINEEKEIATLSKKIKEDNEFKVEFGDTEKIIIEKIHKTYEIFFIK